jgi:hypothetical protein
MQRETKSQIKGVGSQIKDGLGLLISDRLSANSGSKRRQTK